MLNQGRIKCVKFCPQTKIIDFYKDDKPIWISSSKQKIEKIKPSCDVFIKSNSEKLDEETKKNDEILSRLDKDEFNSTLPSNRKKLEEIKEDNDYRLSHRPTQTGAYASNISNNGQIPSDVYEHPEWYF